MSKDSVQPNPPKDTDAVGGAASNPPGGTGPTGPAPSVPEAADLAPEKAAQHEAAPTPPAAQSGAASDPDTERRIAAEQRAAAGQAQAALGGAVAARVPPRAAQSKARPALAPALQEVADVVARLLPGAQRDGATFDLPAFRLPPEGLVDACRTLRDAPELALQYLTCVSGVDYADHVEIVYHLFSITHPGCGLVLKVDAPKTGDHGTADVPSVTGVWPGADWHEREIFDLLGVRFAGHPDLRRILMPEGFDGGYPLRKDYVDVREQRRRKVRQR